MTADRALVAAVRRTLAEAADPERAPAMQAYMKSAMPFLGVAKPERTAALRPVLAAHPPADRATWEATVRALYDEAAYREERYAALALLVVRPSRPWHDTGLVPLVEHLVTTGAWWDLVDEVAGRTVAPLHRADPEGMAPVIRRWARHDDLWLRRTAVLSQLGSKEATDRDLLAEVVDANAASPEFFLRKAIGWALRDLAHRDPDWVRSFLAERGDALSPLSRREAAKHL
ncbi:MAG: DNA alkylation repair protein [Candidatus Nanopelagicales bacterium]